MLIGGRINYPTLRYYFRIYKTTVVEKEQGHSKVDDEEPFQFSTKRRIAVKF